MIKRILMVFFVIASSLKGWRDTVSPILPSPTVVTVGQETDTFTLSAKTILYYEDAHLAPLAHQLLADIHQQTGLNLSLKQETLKHQQGIVLEVNPMHQQLLAKGQTYGLSAHSSEQIDERYAIAVSARQIRLIGATDEALFRACTSLRQLMGVNKEATTFGIVSQLVQDAPKMAWRGLSLDVSRYFIKPDEVKQVIDMMALYKYNVLHLHLSDNQGWRLEIKQYPELARVGGFVENNDRQGGYYTQEQFSDLVRYAAARYITIVPELELPGHSKAIFQAYPQFRNIASLPFEFEVPGQALYSLDPTDEAAMAMVKSVLTEVAALTPGRFIHIGGDETFGMHEEPYKAFIHQARAIVHSLGKEVVGWQEMTRAEVSEGDVLQHWIRFSRKQIEANEHRKAASATTKQVNKLPAEVTKMLGATYQKAGTDIPTGVKQGAKILLSPGAFTYLDCPFEETSVDASQQAICSRLGMKHYAPQNLRDQYEWDATSLFPELNWKQDIAGVEATIFCETIESFHDVQLMLMPRLTGVAEQAWSTGRILPWDNYRRVISTHQGLWKAISWDYFKSSLIDWEKK